MVSLVTMSALYQAYTIYGHGRFGQTIGKHLMGIRVLRMNGEPIRWREAWLRSAIELVYMVLSDAATLIALWTIPDNLYVGVSWLQRGVNVQEHVPEWNGWVEIAGQVWIWSEFVVLLLNRKRRSLHDFMAGTVVAAQPAITSATASATEVLPAV